jgi:flagellar L-ring protein precursor FlgH
MKSPFLIAIGLSLVSAPLCASDLYQRGNWASLAADRKPSQVGDIITVVVINNSAASNSVATGSKKHNAVGGDVALGTKFSKNASLGFGGSYDGGGTNMRSDKMAAQLSARVTEVLPNGDLIISGLQAMRINGDTTNIKVSGRIRLADIDSNNQVLSSRLADAHIEYDGRGFAARSAKPGIITRIFNVLGIL